MQSVVASWSSAKLVVTLISDTYTTFNRPNYPPMALNTHIKHDFISMERIRVTLPNGKYHWERPTIPPPSSFQKHFSLINKCIFSSP
ncbi:hypothetical protein BCR33DRAFT_448205 [Rhizoclosmatium globosum]|uniref:Uncharacterized protein n=1 Tax=Rhizoclosmatium globosum TaxID=329046 RepID=A0A1Y2BSA9_9FUNG|nr:hypothetical protein BCR33DRAFT_448205 [Rhizoclosmatium globosum]|eukprot:ORY37623.1 hypothetical protein BCR33DRAFT_448205 [Rhizoclosmatium globosum]